MTAKTKKTTDGKPARKAAPARPAAGAKPAPAKKPEPAAARAAEAAKAAEPARAAQPVKITHDMIAQRAYFIWLNSGRPQGQDRQIWLRAEAELRTAIARSPL